MNKFPLIIFVFLLAFSSFSCKSGASNTGSKPKKVNLKLLYAVWDVESISAGGQLVTGVDMGKPQYEFTETGQRIKIIRTPPQKIPVNYKVVGDSIHYSGEQNLPSVRIVELSKKRLVLQNDKAEWKLYRSK